MTSYRELLRNNKQQQKLDKNGFVILNLLTEKNYIYILKILQQDIDGKNTQHHLNQKLQSKIEYHLFNCLPLYYEVLKNDNSNFIINPPILDERKQKSICIILPIFTEEKQVFSISFLKKAHLENIFPRGGSSIIKYEEYKNTQNLKLNYGEIVLFYNNVPYSVRDTNKNLYLKIDTIPYEGRLSIYKNNGDKIEQYRITNDKYVMYKKNIKSFDYSTLRKIEDFQTFDISTLAIKEKKSIEKFLSFIKNTLFK